MNDTSSRWAAIGPLEQLKNLGGLAFLQKVVREEFPTPPIAATLGFRFVEVEPGRSVITMRPDARWYNLIQTVHGGVAATLLDTVMATAILSTLPVGKGFTTLELKLNYVRPITDQTGDLRAEGTIINVGRTIGTAEGRLTDPQGKLLAHGTTTCLILDV